MAAPGPLTLLLLLLLLAVIFPHQITSANMHQCLHMNNTVLGCAVGRTILLERAFLGVSEGHDPATGNCPKTSDKCHQSTNRLSQVCNRHQNCFLVNQGKPVINVENGCGLPNYIEIDYTCIQVSTVIKICDWSGVRRPGVSYIVNNNYPLAIQPQPHRCQCTIQTRTDSTASQTGVTLIVRDAYFTGKNCQQKLSVEFPGHYTQNSTVCSSNQRITGRIVFSESWIPNGAIVSLAFEKFAYIGDAGTFLIQLQVTGPVAINCIALSQPSATPNLKAMSISSVTSPVSSTLETPHISHFATSKPSVSSESKTTSPPTSSYRPSNTSGSMTAPSESYDHSIMGMNGSEPTKKRTYILAGLAIGVVALIILVFAVVLIRFRKKENQQMPTEPEPPSLCSASNDKSAVQDIDVHGNNNMNHNHTEGQFTDSLQIYAVIPDLVISTANRNQQGEVIETPYQAASGIDNTAFTFQTVISILPTETYAIVDKSKKTKNRARASYSPENYSEPETMDEEHLDRAYAMDEDSFAIHTADLSLPTDTYVIGDKRKRTHARPEGAHDSPVDYSEEKLNEYHPELASKMEETTFTIHTAESTLPTYTYAVVDRNQQIEARSEAAIITYNDNMEGEMNCSHRDVASAMDTTTLVSQTTDPNPPTEEYAVEDKIKKALATLEAARSSDDFAEWENLQRNNPQETSSLIEQPTTTVQMLTEPYAVVDITNVASQAANVQREENLQMNNPQETSSLIEQPTTTVQMLTEPYAVVDITNVASQAANVQEEENLQMNNPQETSSIMEQPTTTVQMLTEPYAVVDITNIATKAAHVQDYHRRVDHQRENRVAPECLAAAVVEDPVYEAIDWREGPPGKDSGRGRQDNESCSSEGTSPSSSQTSLVAQVEDDSSPHNTTNTNDELQYQ